MLKFICTMVISIAAPASFAQEVTLRVEVPRSAPEDLVLAFVPEADQQWFLNTAFEAFLKGAETSFSFGPRVSLVWTPFVPTRTTEGLRITQPHARALTRGLDPILWIRKLNLAQTNWVPISAIENPTGSKPRVYVEANSRIERRDVAVWPQVFGDRLLVTRFSKRGERLVVQGVEKIKRAQTLRFVAVESLK
jgi:hypothetical protein